MSLSETLRKRVREFVDGPGAIPGRRDFLRDMAVLVGGGAVLTACGVKPTADNTPLPTRRPDGSPTPRPDASPTAGATDAPTQAETATDQPTKQATEKPEPSETATTAPEFQVDAEGYMLSESGNYGVKDLIGGTVFSIVPGANMDDAVISLLLDEMHAGKYNPSGSVLGPIFVDVPTAQSGSGYVEGYKPMTIDFSKIRFCFKSGLTNSSLDSVVATNPNTAVSMTSGGDGQLFGFVTRMGDDGFTYVDINIGIISPTVDLKAYGDLETLRHIDGQVLFWSRMIFRRTSGDGFRALFVQAQSRATAMKYPIFGIRWK